MALQIQPGMQDVSIEVYIVDTDGLPITTAVFNTTDLDLFYRRSGAAAVQITLADLATPALTDPHLDGGFLHIGAGVYRLDLPDAACAANATNVVVFGTIPSGVVMPVPIQLIDMNALIGGAVTQITNAINALNNLSAAQVGTVLEGYGLQFLVNTAADLANDVQVNSVLAQLLAASGDPSDFTGATDALDALGTAIAAILDDTGTNGVELSATAIAAINAEVVDALATDANAEPTAVPAANASMAAKIAWLYMRARNRRTTTATTETVFADDGTTPIAVSTVSDDDTTTTRGEYTDAP